MDSYQYGHHKSMTPEIKAALSAMSDISSWTTTLPLIVGIVRYRNLSWGLRAIIALCIVSLVIDYISSFSNRENRIGLYTIRVYSVCEFTLLSLFFISASSRRNFRRTLRLLIFVFVGVALLDVYIRGIEGWDDLTLAIESVILIFYSLFTLYFMIQDLEFPNITATPQFWIIAAILVYFGGDIFVFASSNYIIATDYNANRYLWAIHGVLHIIFNILLTIGLWKAKPASR